MLGWWGVGYVNRLRASYTSFFFLSQFFVFLLLSLFLSLGEYVYVCVLFAFSLLLVRFNILFFLLLTFLVNYVFFLDFYLGFFFSLALYSFKKEFEILINKENFPN